MTRDVLFAIARKHGWGHPDGMPTATMLAGIKKDLLDYLKSPEGRTALGQAPPWLREKRLEEIADLLLREVV